MGIAEAAIWALDLGLNRHKHAVKATLVEGRYIVQQGTAVLANVNVITARFSNYDAFHYLSLQIFKANLITADFMAAEVFTVFTGVRLVPG